MSRLTDRLERDLCEIAAAADPSPDAWASVVARLGEDGGSDIPLASAGTARSRRPAWIVAVAAAVVVAASAALIVDVDDDGAVSTATDPTTAPSTVTPSTVPAIDSTLPTVDRFTGTWTSTDTDGSSQTMQIARSDAGGYTVVVRDDDVTPACAGATASVTGTAVLESDVRLVITEPEVTCDDGAAPGLGPTPDEELARFAFELDAEADVLVDGLGVVWRRAWSDDEPVVTAEASGPFVGSASSGGMWPQATLAEVRAAQELADAGDPAYAWQLFAPAEDAAPWGAGIITGFLEQGLGWDEYLPHGGYAYAEGGGAYAEVMLIRCAPGETNPLAPLYAEIPAELRGCAPTIDERTYETVMLSLSQPARTGSSGLWVVERWELLQSPSEGPLFWLLYPDLGQVRQVVPPSEEEVADVLTAFLQARIDGEGAEQYLLTEPDPSDDRDVPVLYATTGGVPYERFGTPRTSQGPVWPTGWRQVELELVAEDGTVVQQDFHVVRQGDRLGLIYGFADELYATTEDGEPVAEAQRHFNDTVTFTAPPALSLRGGSVSVELADGGTDGAVVMAVDPDPARCEDPAFVDRGAEPADAEAVARALLAAAGADGTGPVPVEIAGVSGLQIDMASATGTECLGALLWSDDLAGRGAERAHVYLVDIPEPSAGNAPSWRPRVLVIAVLAPPDQVDAVQEQAAPILASVTFAAD